MLSKIVKIGVCCALFVSMFVFLRHSPASAALSGDYTLQPITGATTTATPVPQGDLTKLYNAALSDRPLFGTLKGAVINYAFASPTSINRIGFVRSGYKDWAIATKIDIQINGGAVQHIDLSSPRVDPLGNLPADIDVININQVVQSMTVTVIDTAGPNKHGTFEMGIAVPKPPVLDFNKLGAVPSTASGMTLSVESDETIPNVNVVLSTGDSRKSGTWAMQWGTLPQGSSAVTFNWDQFVNAAEPHLKLDPLTINKVELQVPAERMVKIVTRSFLSDGTLNPPAWDQLPALDLAPDAEGWRSGIPEQGFGRFGYLTDNGLLVGNLNNKNKFFYTAVNDVGAAQGANFRFQLGSSDVLTWQHTKANWTSVVQQSFYADTDEMPNDLLDTTWDQVALKKPQLVTYSSLAPGFLVDSKENKFTFIPDDAAAGVPSIMYMNGGQLTWATDAASMASAVMSEGWMVAVWPNSPTLPILLAPKHKPSLIKTEGNSLVLEFPTAIDRIAVGTPSGFRQWGGTIGAADAASLSLSEQSRKLAAILRAYPKNSKMTFKDEQQSVLVRENFEHVLWTNDWNENAHAVAPSSPLMNFASDQSYPVEWVTPLTDPSIPTKYGPYRYSEGRELQYRLEIPPLDTLTYLRPSGTNGMADTVASATYSRSFNNTQPLQTTSLSTWWMWAPSSLGITLMNENQRSQFVDKWKQALEQLLIPNIWMVREEPNSGAKYMISYAWKEGHTDTFGDINSGIGAVLYGPYAYARVSGDWDLVNDHWPLLNGAFRYFLVEHDWALMQTGAREHNGASAIDMDGIGYEGAVAYTKMAEQLGKADEAAIGRLMVARLALSTTMRWLGDRWVSPAVDPEDVNYVTLGFTETSTFDRKKFNSDPDTINSEIALSLSWVGQYPELYNLHLWGLGTPFWDRFEYEIMDNRVPNWRIDYPGNRNNHAANVSAHLYMRGMLGENSQSLLSQLTAQAYGANPAGDNAMENAALFSMALGKDFPVRLLDWKPAALLKGEYDSSNHTATLKFDSETPFDLVMALDQSATDFTINGVSQGGLASGPRVQVTLPSGLSEIVLSFN